MASCKLFLSVLWSSGWAYNSANEGQLNELMFCVPNRKHNCFSRCHLSPVFFFLLIGEFFSWIELVGVIERKIDYKEFPYLFRGSCRIICSTKDCVFLHNLVLISDYKLQSKKGISAVVWADDDLSQPVSSCTALWSFLQFFLSKIFRFVGQVLQSIMQLQSS